MGQHKGWARCQPPEGPASLCPFISALGLRVVCFLDGWHVPETEKKLSMLQGFQKNSLGPVGSTLRMVSGGEGLQLVLITRPKPRTVESQPEINVLSQRQITDP